MRFFFTLFCIMTLLFPAPGSGRDDLSRAMDAGELIRLHVIARSDSPQDQAKKLQVRDAVLESAQRITAGLDFREAEQAILKNIAALESAARQADESARAVYGTYEFPEKSYGGVTVPAGSYPALRIVLGEGEGQNWWCILYPAGCGVREEGKIRFESLVLRMLRKWGWIG